jgi:histidinol phosphatase-like PHP family hydrolase
MQLRLTRREALKVLGLGTAGALAGCRSPGWTCGGGLRTSGGRWYRGNLHMHTYWSDGRAFPEQAVSIYKGLGYDFIALTEHNVFADDPAHWRPVLEKEGKWPPEVTRPYHEAYLQAYGGEAETREANGKEEVRLKTYAEMQKRFDQPGRFLLLPGVEVTQTINGIQVHLNTVNQPDVIPFVKGGEMNKKADGEVGSVSELIGLDAREVAALAVRQKRPAMLTLNHPQWVYWDIQPQNLIDNPEVRFFEVCNGGSAFAPHPDALSVTNDRFWDAVNACRCLKGQPLLYGIGTDDTHHYINRKPDQRLADAWVMVRGEALTPDALLAAMHAGDYYATTGVTLDDVAFDAAARTLRVRVKPEPGVTYRIRFITTKRGFDQTVRTVESPAEKGRGARSLAVYSEDVGRTASLVEGASAQYRMAADDLYVRAKVESSVPTGYARHFHPEVQVAWTQPYGAA